MRRTSAPSAWPTDPEECAAGDGEDIEGNARGRPHECQGLDDSVLEAAWDRIEAIVRERTPTDGRPDPESVPARPASRPGEASPLRPEPANWVVLVALLAASALVRVAVFNGLLGSDDVVYLRRAVEVSQGM